jgi:hypothetical protein
MNEKSWFQVLKSYSDNPKSKIQKRPRRPKSNMGGCMKHIVGFLAIFVTLAACGEMAVKRERAGVMT